MTKINDQGRRFASIRADSPKGIIMLAGLSRLSAEGER